MAKNHLIIGLGGTGGKIIRALRKNIYQEFRAPDPVGVNMGYLYVDSSDEMMDPEDPTWRTLGRSVQLDKNSQLVISDANLKTRLANINNYPGISPWIGSAEEWGNILNTINTTKVLGGQKRRLGRFLFACKVAEFKTLLKEQIRLLQKNGEIAVTIHICCGLAGGTGSGSIIDVIAQVRDTYPDAKAYRIAVYALLPDKYPKEKWDTGNYHANGYAALMELNALSVGAFHPYDVSGEKGRLELQDPFNGCYLFTNENENGLSVDVGVDVPNIAASFLYQKVVAIRSVKWDTLRRIEDAENGNSSPEGPTNAQIGERSKRFLAFGIKRLAIPEEEIREFLAYSFARQAALQLQYNNWSDAQSFADEPSNRGFKEFVTQPDVLQRWLLSDDHLRLSVGILRDEINNPKWKPINNSWQDVMPNFKSFVRETYKNPKVWLDELDKLAEKRYAQDYRELGVKRFYETKEGDRRDHTREIRSRVERDLIEEWRNGVQSLFDIRRLLEALTASLQQRLAAVDDKIVNATQNEERAAGIAGGQKQEWATVGWLREKFGARDRLFDAHAETLLEQYTHRTNIAAWKFAKGLLQALVGEFTSLQSEVDSGAKMLGDVAKLFSEAAAARCNDGGMTDMRQQLVKFYEPDAVKSFTRTLVRDKDEQFKQTKVVRDKLLAELGDNPSFALINQRLSREKLVNLLEQTCEENAIRAHDNLVMEVKERRLLGDSIIERLYQQFGGNVEQVQKYVRDLVAMAGNYVAFEPEEITKTDDSIPKGMKTKVPNFTVVMPDYPQRPEFVAAVRRAFSASTNVPDMEFIPSVEVPADVKPNEITLVSVTNLFPLRYVHQTAFLREKYEARLKGGEAARVKLELHSEGDGTQFPSLFVRSTAETIDLGLPYVLLGRALDVIQKLENPVTGLTNMALVTKDENGFDNDPVVLGNTLVDSVGRLNSDAVRTISATVQELLDGEQYAHVTKRAELQKTILTLVEEVKAERKNNVQDETYRRFLNAGKKAVSILQPKG